MPTHNITIVILVSIFHFKLLIRINIIVRDGKKDMMLHEVKYSYVRACLCIMIGVLAMYDFFPLSLAPLRQGGVAGLRGKTTIHGYISIMTYKYLRAYEYFILCDNIRFLV
ncbi:hypothetical protein BT93_L2751 [Corymbia citriodora subsp. variegata]|uniref:Uncharacterized protein n=1 Tax=Corymbia citriodora subsp. variegata TaxID=360336 RepID=A0A8T0CIZ0_CORYI|nr:hypothetical protein BT93_L2751 [Corymbia citriodora subsp. variegata]